MRETWRIWVVLGAMSILLSATTLVAQETTVEFTVLDASDGKPLPGAKVLLVAEKPADEQYMGPVGKGRFVDLSPGRYIVQVSLAGFKSVQKEIDVSVGSNQVAVHLEPFRLVSVIQLLAMPDRYDGLPVVVDGFCSVGFEDDALFLHRDDWMYTVTSNALWIDADPLIIDERYNKKHVTIFGIFASDSRAGLYGGGIRSIEKIVVLERRK